MSEKASEDSLRLEITVDQAPEEVFAAVTDVRAWWNQNVTGGTAVAGDEFIYSDAGGLSCRIRLSEAAAPTKIFWEVVEAHLTEFDDHDEWSRTTMTFEIIPDQGGSTLRFIHLGLTPPACATTPVPAAGSTTSPPEPVARSPPPAHRTRVERRCAQQSRGLPGGAIVMTPPLPKNLPTPYPRPSGPVHAGRGARSRHDRYE